MRPPSRFLMKTLSHSVTTVLDDEGKYYKQYFENKFQFESANLSFYKTQSLFGGGHFPIFPPAVIFANQRA